VLVLASVHGISEVRAAAGCLRNTHPAVVGAASVDIVETPLPHQFPGLDGQSGPVGLLLDRPACAFADFLLRLG
jgi:hypothetical protein